VLDGQTVNSFCQLSEADKLRPEHALLGRTNSACATWNGYLLADYDAAGQLIQAWPANPMARR
jgi:hypothetical protein